MNNPLLNKEHQYTMSAKLRERYESETTALFRSLEGMTWPLFSHENREANADILRGLNISSQEDLDHKMVSVFEEAYRFLMDETVDPGLCASFMRKACAVTPAIGETMRRFEKLEAFFAAPIDVDYQELARDFMSDNEETLERALDAANEDSLTPRYGEAWNILIGRRLIGRDLDDTSEQDGGNDIDSLVLGMVNDGYRAELRAALEEYVDERLDAMGVSRYDYDETDNLELMIQQHLYGNDELEEYDREIDWEYLKRTERMSDKRVSDLKARVEYLRKMKGVDDAPTDT